MGDEIKEVKAVEEKKTTQAASPAAPAEKQKTEEAGQATGSGTTRELDPGKSTVKGDTDYFDGKSVITDADTVIDISTIMKEHNASNMKPEQLAQYLKEKGYDVTIVKMGNRSAVQFKNGDYFVDSDGDGNLGTKDQNFQSALSTVEQKFGIDLSELKSAKALQVYHGGSGGGADAAGLNGLGGQYGDLTKIFSQLDREMAARGYNGEKKSYDLWQEGKLPPVLQELGISVPPLPDPSEAAAGAGVQKGLNLFGAAFSIAEKNEEMLGL